ncbi:hypothetical protein QR685DRAFT_543925 [Neurospora intermedia]|uniref:Uncharacterized protein n=1 Tax=Neurospora intermedia TaxID=5142 RepID=A0ABR3DBW8_NEUIN
MAVSLFSSLKTPHAKYSAIAKLPTTKTAMWKRRRELPFMLGAWCLSPGLAGMPITTEATASKWASRKIEHMAIRYLHLSSRLSRDFPKGVALFHRTMSLSTFSHLVYTPKKLPPHIIPNIQSRRGSLIIYFTWNHPPERVRYVPLHTKLHLQSRLPLLPSIFETMHDLLAVEASSITKRKKGSIKGKWISKIMKNLLS